MFAVEFGDGEAGTIDGDAVAYGTVVEDGGGLGKGEGEAAVHGIHGLTLLELGEVFDLSRKGKA